MYQKMSSSYFTNNNAISPPLRLVSNNELKRFDEVAEEAYPYSLHHQIWPAVKSRNHTITLHSNKYDGPQPNLSSHLFPELQFSVYNLSQASPVTLSRLDIDSFLNLAALCACAVAEEQQQNNLTHPDRLPTLPADLTNPLCSEEQEKWWLTAYKMYRKEQFDSTGDTRQTLQRGLEVIRCIGNHGLHPVLLIHLARVFQYRAKQMKEKNPDSGDIPAIEARSELYWSAAIPLLERLQNNQTIRSSNVKLFVYIGKEMNNMHITHAIEEGKLLLAQKLIRDKLYQQAIEDLQALKCPEASFEQGKIYKKLADETMENFSKENVTSEMRSQHIIILSKARNCFYLTLDRLRSPDADPKHPLNAELCTYIATVENELKRIDPDTLHNDRNRRDCEDLSEESYSSAHSEEHPTVTNSLPIINNSLHTPVRNIRRTPRLSSTPRQDLLDVSRNRSEARPSPERLDAQIRQLVHSIESLKDQNREQHRAMLSKLDELIKIIARNENVNSRSNNTQIPVVNQNLEDDLYGLYAQEEYRDYNNYNNTSLPTSTGNRASGLPQHMFTPARDPYAPMMCSSPAMALAALQSYYRGELFFPYPPAAAAAAAAANVNERMPAYSMSPLYPRAGFEQPLSSMQRMSDSILNPGVFTQRLNSQVSDYSQNLPNQQLSATQQFQQQISPIQLNEQTIPESKLSFTPTTETCVPESSTLSKENVTSSTTTALRKSPPVNVVITTSDTLPTTVPTIQPMLSVTIPAQHRLGISPSITSSGPAQEPSSTVPHSYQISMPSQPTIPTTVNLPPLSTTITTVTSAIANANINDPNNTSVLSTNSRHSCSDTTEVEHDPIPDFAPIIPLPDEVPVTTGEENEEELFCARAKLFRFVDKEWKERGIGNIKLLKNVDGKVRLLMRREQVHKICANHMLRKDMDLTMMPNNEKAYIWVANDFADEELKLEKLCVRFKTPEEAASFKEHFDKAKDSLPECTDQAQKKSSDTNIEKSVNSEVIQKKSDEKIGGFTFTAQPIIQKPALVETPKLMQKSQETSKPSPFATFSFTEKPDKSQMPPRPSDSSFNFSIHEVPVFRHKETMDETVHIELEANLTHFQKTGKPECADGVIKILSEKISGKIRLLMDKGEHSKAILNEIITPAISFCLKDETINWTMPNDKTNSYLIRFKSLDQAGNFHKVITNLFEKSTKQSTKKAQSVTNQKPLSELFKPAVGSWECKDCYTRNNANVTNCMACQAPSPSSTNNQVTTSAPTSTTTSNKPLSEMFKPPAGSWECTACYTRNTSTNQYCVACDVPKDPSMPPKPKTAGGFSINSQTPNTALPYSFGIPQTAQQTPSKESQGFSFNMTSKSSEVVTSPISIFGNNKPTNLSSGFSFGTQAPSTPPSSAASGPFTLGSPGKSFGFQFQGKSPSVKSPERPETSDDEVVEEAEDVYFTPVIPLPDKIDVKTGEENENVLYSHRAKLFKFDSSTKEWKERGLGDIKLLRHKETKKLRLVMRRDQVLKLCLNHAVTSALEIVAKDSKTWTWSAGDYSEGEIEYIHFACRFKSPEVAEEFKTAVENACKDISSEINDNSFTKESPSRTESSSDIEVIYQIQVTPEEKAAAAKLGLPENFYAYKNRKDCSGCIGCDDDLADKFFNNKIDKTKQPIVKLKAPTFVKATESVSNDTVNQPFLSNAFTKTPTSLINSTQSTSPPVFGSDKNIFENGSAGGKATFVFGKQSSVKPNLNPETVLENTKICSPTGKSESSSITASAAPTNIFSGFGASSLNTATSSDIFKPPSSGASLDSQKFGSNIFSANKDTSGQSTNIFSTSTNLQTTNIFNTTPSMFDAATTANPTCIFGTNASSSVNLFNTNTTAAPTNLFSTNTTVTSTNIFNTNTTAASTSIFGTNTIAPTSMFGTNTPAASTSIFSTNTTTTSMFGGQMSATTIFSPLTPQGSVVTVSDSSSVSSSSNTKSTIPAVTTPISSSTFGSASSVSKLNFGASNSSLPISNIFSGTKSTSTSENILMAKPTENSSKPEGLTFLPTENSISFSDLVAKVGSTQKPSFQTDPNFIFEGAGATVFGGKLDKKIDSKQSKSSSNVKTEKVNNDEEGEDNNENGDEHDPYFEPIIPLPDAIEVRTGEEEEKKVFCERAKLFRYDQDTREWKERGVGEMKLLHHEGHDTYRLLLRREQVHKVVCNLLLTPEIEFLPLNSSDRAWIWGGMNYADSENPELEKLAVRFKSSELAVQFKEAIDEAQQALAEKQNQVYDDSQDENYGNAYADDDKYNEDEEDEENEDNDDETEMSMFENRATLYAQSEGDLTWNCLGEGDLKVLYDSDLLGAKIVGESDNSELTTETIVSIDMKMTCVDTVCTWAGLDYAVEPISRRTLRAVFKSKEVSKEMYKIFQEGQQFAAKAEIRD